MFILSLRLAFVSMLRHVREGVCYSLLHPTVWLSTGRYTRGITGYTVTQEYYAESFLASGKVPLVIREP